MAASLVACLLVLNGILRTSPEIEGEKYENTLLLSSTSTNVFGKDGRIHLIPGTLYDTKEINSSSIFLKNINNRILSMEVDYNRNRLYLYELTTAAIYVTNNFDWKTDFKNISLDLFYHGISRDHSRLGLDWVSGNVYWTDPLYKWIAVQSGDNNDTFKILIHDNLERPTSLVVDPINKYLFWSDVGSKTVKIERSTLTGSDRKTIISNSLVYPISIDVDRQANKIVWLDEVRGTLEIANFDGSERQALKRLSDSAFYDLAVFKLPFPVVIRISLFVEMVYDGISLMRIKTRHFCLLFSQQIMHLKDLVCVTDLSSSMALIIKKNNGALYSKIFSYSNDSLIAAAIYSKVVQPIQNDVCADSGCSDICVNDRSGPVCMCREGFRLNADNKTCSEDIGKFHRAVIWTNRTHICLTDIRVLATFENTTECVYTQGINITHIDIDMAERTVVFTDSSDIFALRLGTNSAKIRLISTSSTVTGLAADWRDNNIYWSEGGNPGRINLVSQATGNDYVLIHMDLIEPRCLLLQPLDNYMFWISGLIGFNKLERSDLDGLNRMTIPAGLINPISLTSDLQTRRLYFIDGGLVKTCEPDGKDLKALRVSLFGPHIVLLYKNYLVVADGGFPGKLVTMDKNTTSLKFKYSDLDIESMTDIKVLDASLQLRKHGPCDVLNGHCEHICIPTGQNKICRCEYGFQLDSDRQACSSEVLQDSFLLVTDWTHNRIYQISLENEEVTAVDTDTFGSPVGVAYNYMTQELVWSTQNLIQRLSLRTGEYKILLRTESFFNTAYRFAIDYTNGNIFFTTRSTFLFGKGTVAVLSSTGRHKILIEDESKPRAIALDVKQGLIFWTDTGDVPLVKKANMDGTDIRTIVNSGIEQPNGLAIDIKEKMLYVIDGVDNSILRCTYTGSCMMYFRDAEAHLMDIKLLGNYLYYTAWNKVYITKLHKKYSTYNYKIAGSAELGRLDSLTLYSSFLTHEPISSACSPNNGLGACSTFCLPKSSGYTCACEDGIALLSDGKTCTNALNSTSIEKVSQGIPVAAVGGGAGGGAVLIIAIVILILFVKRSRNKRRASSCYDTMYLYRNRFNSEVSVVPERDEATYNTPFADLIRSADQTRDEGLELSDMAIPPNCSSSTACLTPLQ